MAQLQTVEFVDDLDGTTSEDISTVTFGLDGVEYEIDLTQGNAESLRGVLEEFVEHARRTGGRRQRGTRPGGTGSGPDAAVVREWAQTSGYELAARGRIPAHVTDAYQEAMASPPPPKARSKTAALTRIPRRALPAQPAFTDGESTKAARGGRKS